MEATVISIKGWMDKPVWYIHTMEYYSALKRKETVTQLRHYAKWSKPAIIMYNSTSMRYLEYLMKKEGINSRVIERRQAWEAVSVNWVQNFSLGREKRSRDTWWWWLYNNVNTLNAMKMYMLKWYFFACLCKYAYLSTIKILVQYIFMYRSILYIWMFCMYRCIEILFLLLTVCFY